ncbi:hypothetical protein [Maridesulfovibrio sp.]|uniref:tyrosine-type recombinase/integrase n=1 Tax=Maridesulfovibrio sp. TaxID=2795000 RepID=UPI0029CA3A15|nr:hypothetical protein [Maridesulfovibrio sp.]
MSVRRRKDGYWIVDFRDENGKAKSRSFGKSKEGKKKAVEFDLTVKLLKNQGKPLPVARPGGMYLDELCQLWINYKKTQGRKTGWLKDWISLFNKKFAPELTDRPCDMLTQSDITNFMAKHYSKAAQSTRNRYTGYLSSIFEYGYEHGHIKKNPLKRWKKGKENSRQSMLTLKDLQKIKDHAPDHLAWAIEVAWNIPVRPGKADLFPLRFDNNVDFYMGTVKVYHTKVNKWSKIECSNNFMKKLYIASQTNESGYLIEYKGEPVHDVGTALDRAAGPKGADLPYTVCMTDIRHLWITTMVNKGVEPSTIAYLAGTSVRMIIKNYYEPHSAERKKAAKMLPEI